MSKNLTKLDSSHKRLFEKTNQRYMRLDYCIVDLPESELELLPVAYTTLLP